MSLLLCKLSIILHIRELSTPLVFHTIKKLEAVSFDTNVILFQSFVLIEHIENNTP